jgi:hypothetical protein
MSRERGGESAPKREYGRFGYHGNQVGRAALWMLGDLLKEKPNASDTSDEVTWDKSDLSAFHMLQELDTGIKFIEPGPRVEGSDIGDLHRVFARLHASLPFSEPEREWLWSRQHKPGQEIPHGLIGETAEIVSAGVLHVLQGRDLVRRWWAWRRERDEFAGQASLDEARQALATLTETLVIESNLPSEWQEIRAQMNALGDAT